MLFFGNKCCFFIQISIFNWMNVQNPEKSTFVVEKHYLFFTNEQQWCYVDSSIKYSIIYSLVDNSNQHPSMILRFSKNLDIWQTLKIDFEHHICCYVYDLINITNWQSIGEGASVATNRQQMLPPHCLISHFSFVVRIFFRYW